MLTAEMVRIEVADIVMEMVCDMQKAVSLKERSLLDPLSEALGHEERFWEQLRGRIKEGMQVLDQASPGWETRIDLQKLDLGNPVSCMLGQLYGTYLAGLNELAINIRESCDLGFERNSTCSYRDMTHEWRAQISAKLEQVKNPSPAVAA